MSDTLRGIHRRIAFEVTHSLRCRFWAAVDKRGPDECWPWTKSLRVGYGAIGHQGKTLSAHVVSYVIHNGPPDVGQIVCHSCDNRTCCNPAHLTAGTFQQNVTEMFERGRAVILRGEDAPTAKMTEADARRVLELREQTGYGAVRLSRLLNLPRKAIDHLIYGETWRHVTTPNPSMRTT